MTALYLVSVPVAWCISILILPKWFSIPLTIIGLICMYYRIPEDK